MSDTTVKLVNRSTVRANIRIYDLVLKKWVYTTTCGACGRRRVAYIVSHTNEFSFTEPGAST
jgi:hypothetical protein